MSVFNIPPMTQAAGDGRYARTVNGVEPDASGNITIGGGGEGGLTLLEDPPGSGLFTIVGV